MGIYRDNSTTKGNRKPWIADVTMKHPDGRELRRKKRARTQTEAKDFERALETQLKNELYNPERLEQTKAPFVKDFISDFLQWYATTKKPSTLYVRTGHLNKYVLPFFGEKRLTDITTPLCASFVAYIRQCGLSLGQSINSITSALGVLLRRAQTLGFIKTLPTLEHCKVVNKEASALTEEDFSTLLDVAPSAKWRALMLLAGVCGLRRGELAALSWDDVLLERKLIHVKRNLWNKIEGTPKNGESRYVPMTDEVIEALQVLPEKQGRVCEGVSFERLKVLFRKHHIKGKNWHSLRHTALTELGNAQTPPHTLMKIAGHKKLSTTQIYLHTQQDDLLAAAERLQSASHRSGPQEKQMQKAAPLKAKRGKSKNMATFGRGSSENPVQQTIFSADLLPSQQALSSLVSSLSTSFPLLLPSRGPVAPPGLMTGEALTYFFLEHAELMGVL